MSLLKIKNKGLSIALQFIAVIIAVTLLEIVFLIKIFNLDSSIYIPFIITINIIVAYLFWWKNKENRNNDNNK